MRGNWYKYVVRFGVALAVSLPLIYLFLGSEQVKVFAYKIAATSIGVGLAELVWATGFRPLFGGTMSNEPYVQRSILQFRGILYVAIIISVTLGL